MYAPVDVLLGVKAEENAPDDDTYDYVDHHLAYGCGWVADHVLQRSLWCYGHLHVKVDGMYACVW